MAVSPTVRQRQLGMRLRAIRTQLGLNVEDVAAELMCSPSKISRLETATRSPNLRDIRDLCKVYDIDDATSEELMDLARKAKEPGWWSQYSDLRLYPYIGLEQDASAITSFATFYVPALLQTEEYARAIIKGIAPSIDPAVWQERVEVRLRRQELLDRERPPRYRVLVDEAVLHRPTGGPEVMGSQIDKILKLTEEGKVTVQIVPFEVGAIATQDSNFVLLEFAEPGLSSVVFVESLVSHQILEKQADVDRYKEAIEHLRDSALTPRESIFRMSEMRKSYVGTRLSSQRSLSGNPAVKGYSCQRIHWPPILIGVFRAHARVAHASWWRGTGNPSDSVTRRHRGDLLLLTPRLNGTSSSSV